MKRHFFANAFLLAALLALGAAAPASAASGANYKRTVERYSMPDVTLVNQDGKRVRLLDLVDGGKPVVLDFIYGTCTTICPVLSANFTNFQRRLGEGVGEVQLVSISIDPENDTPAIMKKYLKNYMARPGWDFLTGSRDDIDRVMRAFSAYVPNKMSHYPIMFLRAPRGDHWVRIYGLIGTKDFLAEYEKVVRP
jgi:protein SCO1/2